MDIVSRLKSFINFSGVPVTQFADNCRIPRPTLSQLLNGRNKKVSDEIIGKIHEAYPELSVLWLMFGEGGMIHTKNIETAASQPDTMIDLMGSQASSSKTSAPTLDFTGSYQSLTPNEPENMIDEKQTTTVNTPTTLSFSPDSSKKIVNIIVYYNDNSFESFVPSPEK